MRRLIPSETALVLGGGGAKGAYEAGVMQALRSLGIAAGQVYGTSIGAVNAALYAQGAEDEAAALWESLRLSDVVLPESMALAEEAEGMFSRPDKLLDFITRNAQKKGIDVRPIEDVLRRFIREEALRKSSVRFGLVATRFPSLSAVQKRLEDMKEGTLHDWLMASCACFPAFPMRNIDDQRYIDGGFSDNVPVEMAIRNGARHIIAVDIGRTRAHHIYDRRPNVTYIRAVCPLGGLLSFDPARSARNRQLGYNDTLRAFGRLRGTYYSFDPFDAQLLGRQADDFVVFLTQYEAAMPRSERAGLFALLEEDLPPQAEAVDYFLRACELCALTLDVDPVRTYTFAQFSDALRTALPLEQAESMLSSLLGGRIGVLFAPPQPDRKVVLACLYHLLRREGGFPSLAMHTLRAFPRELLCALTLRFIL